MGSNFAPDIVNDLSGAGDDRVTEFLETSLRHDLRS